MTGAPEVALPGTLSEAIRAQFGRSFRSPYETPIVVVANGLLMTGAWFLLPSPNVLFTLHGALAFPMILASWMFSDVPATNVLGPDPGRAMTALTDPTTLRRLLYAKNIVLWILIVPLCSLIAVGIGLHEHRLATSLFSVIWIAVVPLGALGFSAWVGIRYPYHPLALRHRWEHRRPWGRMIIRWLTLAITPYVVVPLLTLAVTLPTLLVWTLASTNGVHARIPDDRFAWGVVLASAIAVPAWILGHHIGVRIAHRRGSRLIRFLADPDAG